MQPRTVGGAGLSPSPSQLWTAVSTTTTSQTMPRVLATPVRRVSFTPLQSSSVPAAAYPPAVAVAAGSSRHGNHRKPACSYTCLIAMALVFSSKDSLRAGDIYKYIEQEFPYYQNLPKDNWKNSIRHSLSLGHYFRKVGSASGYQGRKGCFWEFVPEKKANIMAEVERFMKQNGRSTKQAPASLADVLANTPSAANMTVEQCLGVHSLPPCSPTHLNRQVQLPLQLPPDEAKTSESTLQYTSEPTMAKISELPEANSAVGLCYSNVPSLPAALNMCMSTCTAGQNKDDIQPVCNLTTTTSVQSKCNKNSSESDEVVILGGNTPSGELDCQSMAVKQQDYISRKRSLNTGGIDAQPPNETKRIKLSASRAESSLVWNASRKRCLDAEDATTNTSKRPKLTAGLFSGLECLDYTAEFNPITGFLNTTEKMAMESYRRSEGFQQLLTFQDELLNDLDCCLLSPQITTDVQAEINLDQDDETEKTSNSQPEEAVLNFQDVTSHTTTTDNHDQELDNNALAVHTVVKTDEVKELLAVTDTQGKEPQQSRDADCFEYFFFLSGKTYPFAIHSNDINTILEQATDGKPAVRLSVKGYSLKPNATVIDILVATVHQDPDTTPPTSVKPIQTNIFPGPNVTASIFAISSEFSGNYEYWLVVKQHYNGCHCGPLMRQNQTQVGPWILHPPAVSCEKWPEVIWNSDWGLKTFVR